VRRRFTDEQRTSTRGCQCSPAVVEENKQDEAVLEGCSPEHKRWSSSV
jgi:hypothetical protein